MVSYVSQSSPRHVSFMPIPIYSRQPQDDELYVMRAFEKHASHCDLCFDPLKTHRTGSTLCAKGHARAIDVAQYVYSKDGYAYSFVDRKSTQRVRLEVPSSLGALKSLLRAWEQGMELLQPVKREVKAQMKAEAQREAHRAEKERPKPARINTSAAAAYRQPAVSHSRTGSSSSSDYEYVYTYGAGETYTSPTYYSYPEANYYSPSQSSPRRQKAPVVYRVAPSSPSTPRVSYYQR